MALRTQTQRYLLFAFIASVSACGLVGVYCLLLGSWGELQARVLGTTAAIATASILGLVSAIPWGRKAWSPIGVLGCVVVAVAMVLGLVAIWWDRVGEDYLKVLGVVCVFAVALPHVGLLALARLRAGYGWVRLTTVAAIAVLACQLSISILAEPESDAWVRAIGIVAIATTCGSIAVPILHRISAIPAEGERADHGRLSLTCPRCDCHQELPVGRSTCRECGLAFRIEIGA